MKALQELAAQLLNDKAVSVVIGYEEGPLGVRPAMITKAEQATRLVFDTRCVQNLATYLSPRRQHLVQLGKKAVVIKGCDARSVAGLLRESQIRREDLVLIGVRCGGVVSDPTGPATLTVETVASRCADCDVREPSLYDHLIGDLPPPPPINRACAEKLAELEAMTPEQRWAFWQAELSRCVRCHACREVCPMCFCERCVADKSQPQWIESSPHPQGNLSWQFTRVLHQAGRCAGCDECERACPAQIPLSLLMRKVSSIVEARFGYRTSQDPDLATPIGTFKQDDKQEFIL
jgi:ferredoxin